MVPREHYCSQYKVPLLSIVPVKSVGTTGTLLNPIASSAGALNSAGTHIANSAGISGSPPLCGGEHSNQVQTCSLTVNFGECISSCADRRSWMNMIPPIPSVASRVKKKKKRAAQV